MGIVLKAAVREKITGSVFWEWFIIEDLGQRVEVTKDEAKAYIEENGLVVAYQEPDGMIWDTPDGEFQHKHKGEFTGKIKKLWEQ